MDCLPKTAVSPITSPSAKSTTNSGNDNKNMKKKLRGVKRTDIQLDYDLYRVNVPMRGLADSYLSVVDLHSEGIDKTIPVCAWLRGGAGVGEHQINHFAPQLPRGRPGFTRTWAK
ncbi:MAG: hypothetical protein M5U34_42570 [Chloroflexi bacterium]|nr:hypothetical protein [Chloroflexota bacterium]